MQKPIVIAYHLIWTAYGCWLPNDPRGSGSRIVRNPTIDPLGDLHYGRKTNQPAGKDVGDFYKRARKILRHDLQKLNKKQINCAACGLANAIEKHRYTCYTCAIMPDHIHIIIRKHKHCAEEMIENLQSLSRQRLISEGHREEEHPVWTSGGWKRFLDRPSAVRHVIQYVERNTLATNLPQQHWPFVTPYNDWPLHLGHNPNSPYARRLRTKTDLLH